MKTCSQCGELKPFEAFNRMSSCKDGRRPSCKECRKPYLKEYWKAQRGKPRKYNYKAKFPERHAHYEALRRARKRNATPAWLTKDQLQEIKDMYARCNEMSDDKTQYHVDHILPLKGENVCGLHVPWNLQILEASKNISKSNKVVDDHAGR